MQARHSANPSFSSVRNWILLIFIFFTQIFFSQAVGQELQKPFFRFSRNELGEVNAVSIYGSQRLRVAKLETFPQLTHVNVLYGATLTRDDVAYLSTLTPLQELIIGQETIDPPVVIEGDLGQLANLKSLKTLSLCKHDIRDSDLQFVSALSELTSIKLNARGEWQNKEYKLSDRCAEYLSQATKLQSIYIQDDAEFSDLFIQRIAENCPDLEHLDICSPNLTDASLRSLADNCKKLKWLDIYTPSFTADGLLHLARIETLDMLWLRGPLASSRNVDELSKLSRLKHLGLNVVEISDEALRAIASLKELEILALHHTIVTDKQFALLQGHPKLESIFIDGRKLTQEQLFQSIDSMPNLRHLSLGPESAVLEKMVKERLTK
jgi:Leucine-rich repeat (LRR) protein